LAGFGYRAEVAERLGYRAGWPDFGYGFCRPERGTLSWKPMLTRRWTRRRYAFGAMPSAHISRKCLVNLDLGRIWVSRWAAAYAVRVNAEVPYSRAVSVPDENYNANPLGAKGNGAVPAVGVGATIANTTYHETGCAGAHSADPHRGRADPGRRMARDPIPA